VRKQDAYTRTNTPCIRRPRSAVPVEVLPSRLEWKTRMAGLLDGRKIPQEVFATS